MKKNVKTKIIFNIIIMGLMIVMTTIARAQTYTTLSSSNLTVNSSGIITSTSYDFSNKYITIPTIADGYTIRGIGRDAFRNKGIIRVNLPSTLRTIDAYAFSQNELTYITFPRDLTSIDRSAFSNNELTTASFSQSQVLTSIGDFAFAGNKLTGASLPGSLTSIGNYAFYNNEITHMSFPAILTSIGSYAFRANKLTSVWFAEPSHLEKIGSLTFAENLGLSEVVLPTRHTSPNFLYFRDTGGNPVTVIYQEDFSIPGEAYFAYTPYTLTSSDVTLDADGLITACSYDFEFTEIFVPQKINGVVVTGIGDGVFQNKGISSVVFPSSLISIGISSFSDNALTSVFFSVPSNVKSIGENAFLNNVSLTSVVLPTSHSKDNFLNYEDSDGVEVTSIEDFTKGYVTNFGPYTLTSSDVTLDADGLITACSYDFEFTDIIVPDEMDGVVVTGIGDGVFQNKGISSVVFPSSLVSIGGSAFYDNQLTSISFPSSLTFIGRNAFRSNTLISVSFSQPSSLRTIEELAFAYNSLSEIVLPTSHTLANFVYFKDTSGNQVTVIQDFNVGGEEYSIQTYTTLSSSNLSVNSSGIITSTSYDFSNKYIIIPNSVDGHTIRGIGRDVFKNKGIIRVKLPSTLTSIGESAFANNPSLGGVLSIPSGVTTIEKTAFYQCSLTGVILPEGLTTIGDSAFSYNDLISLSIPSSMDFIGVKVFGNNPLTSVSFPSSLTSIGYGSFQYNQLTSVSFPSSLVSIGGHAFYGSKLTSVEFPEGLISIGGNAFRSSELTSVSFSQPSSLETIKPSAFYNNPGLSEIILPTSHTSANFAYFKDTSGNQVTVIQNFTKEYSAHIPYTLTSSDVTLDADGLITACSYDFEFTDIIVPEEIDGVVITGIGDGVFQNKGISSVVFPESLRSIGSQSFVSNGLTSVVFPSGLVSVGVSSFSDNGLTSVLFSVPSNVKSIGENAFLNNVSLTSVVLPTSHSKVNFLNYEDSDGVEVTSIEDFTKGYVANFSAYTLTSSDVTLDADGLITSCSYDFEFTDIIVPDEMDGVVVTGIGDGVFQNKGISSVVFPSGLVSVGVSSFSDNGLTSVSFPSGLLSIGISSFSDNGLTSVLFSVPSNVKSIGENAFLNNVSLTSVVLPTSHSKVNFLNYEDSDGVEVTSIEDFTKGYVANFSAYTLTSSDVTLDADGLITACSYDFEFTDIIVPDEMDGVVVTGIGDGVFQNKGISSVVFPSGLVSVGVSSFSDNGLTSVSFPSGLISIGISSFSDNDLTSVLFSVPSNVKSIGENAFLNNVSLTSVVLPTSHSKDNFLKYEDSDGVEVTSIEDFTKGYVANFGPYTLTSSDVTLDADGLITSCSYDFEFTDIIVPDEMDGVVITGIGDGVFQNKGISSVVFPSGLVSVGVSSFSDNGLTSVSFPSGLLSIGISSFSDNGLTSVLFSVPSNVKSIGENAFLNNVSLTSVVLPTSHSKVNFLKYEDSDGVEVTSIEDFTKGYVANFGPYTLTSSDVTLDADGLITACSYDFEFTDIIVPDEMDGVVVTGIGDGVFQNKGISSVVFPESLRSIGSQSFVSNGLTSVSFPSGLLSIGISSFSDNGLTSVLFSVPSNVKSIGENAFLNNVSLTSVVLPTSHSKDNFLNYEDSDGVEVTSIEDFTKGYVAKFFSYTLTSSDVTLDADGLITACSYDFEFTDIVVPDEMDGVVVTGIGDGVFQNKGISSVVFPSGLVSVGVSSFSDNGLTSVLFSVPSNVKSIGENAFLNNVSLTSVVLPTSHSKDNFLNYEDSDGVEVTSIEDFTKGYVANFAPYTLTSSDVTLDADGLITSCSYDFEFTDIIVPDEMDDVVVTGIGDGVFQNKGISSVVFPSGLVSVGVSSFSDNGLTSVLFSVPSNVKSIGENAFLNNVSLTSVVLPTIHSKINFLKYEDSDGVEVTSIEDFTKGYVANFGPYTLTSSDVTLDADGLITACSYDFEFTDITVPDEMDGVVVTGIGDGVFQNKGISSVVFPESLRSIGISSFSDNGLTSVLFSVPSNVKSIGENAFLNNVSLTSVVLPTIHSKVNFLKYEDSDGVEVTSIEDFTKGYVANFGPYTLTSSDVTLDADGLITACSYDFEFTDIIVPDEIDGVVVTGIGDGVFQNKGISSVVFPESLRSIGSQSFVSNGLTSVVFPSGLLSIGISSFSDNGLTSVLFSVPSNVKSIGENAFLNNVSLTSVVLPTIHSKANFLNYEDSDGVEVTSIEDFTKGYVANFSAYTLTSSDVTLDADGLITSCSYDFEFTDIIVPNEIDGVVVTGIGDGVFQNKGISSVVFPYSLVSVGVSSFSDNGLTSVLFSVPSNVKSIGENAFLNNVSLTSVVLPTIHVKVLFLNYEDSDGVEVTSIEDFTKGYVANFAPYTLTSSDVTLDADGLITACSYDFEFTDIIVPDEIDGVVVTGIGDGVFQNKGISSVVFPESLRSIGSQSFFSNGLTSVVFPSGLIFIREEAFQSNQLTSVSFPETLISIGDGAFETNQLTSVYFSTPSSLSTIGIYTFSNNPGLSSIILPSDNSNEGFIGYLDSNANKVLPTESGIYSITDFFLGYVVKIGSEDTVLSLSDDFDELIMTYPNPVQTILTVERGADFRGDVSLRIYNTMGKLVFSRSYSSLEKDMRVDFTTTLQGMYLLEVSDGSGSQIRTRIMKN